MQENNKNAIEPKKQAKKVKYIFCRRNVFVWLFSVIKALINNLKTSDILHNNGSHIITAYPGGGKTLLASHIIGEVDSEKYFFIANMPEFPGYENVYSFNIYDIFKDGEQVASFPTRDHKGRELYAIIFDEINLSFNRRMNRTTEYNDVFMGLVEFIITHRHQDVPRIYFLGQKLELQDTQLQSLFKYQHDIIKSRRWPRYKPFNLGKELIFYPVKLKMVNRVKAENDEFMDLGKEKVKISLEDCLKYNTKYLGSTYAKKKQLKLLGNYPK